MVQLSMQDNPGILIQIMQVLTHLIELLDSHNQNFYSEHHKSCPTVFTTYTTHGKHYMIINFQSCSFKVTE